MKNKWNRVLALLLIVASLLSVFSIFTSAAGSTIALYINRNFDEGWDYNNGLTANHADSFEVDYEFDDNFDYNYFLRFTADSNAASYVKVAIDKPVTQDGSVFQVSLKLDNAEGVDLGTVLQAETTAGYIHNMLAINSNQLFVYNETTPIASLGTDRWCRLTFVTNWSSRLCTVTAEIAGEDPAIVTVDLGIGDEIAAIKEYRLGSTERADAEVQSYRIDDLRVYNGTVVALSDKEVDDIGFGTLVKTSAERTVIPDGSVTKTQDDYMKEGVLMKVRCNWCLFENQRQKIYAAADKKETPYGAPVEVDGVIYVPLDVVLAYLGLNDDAHRYIHPDLQSYDISTGAGATTYISVGRDSAVVNGERVSLVAAPAFMTTKIDGQTYSYVVIAMDDVETLFASPSTTGKKAFVTYDNMGLIIICEKDNVISRDEKNGITNMCTWMKKFLFDLPTGEQIRADVKEHTNNYDHPYLYANQERFNTLRAVWLAEDEDEFLALCDEDEALDRTGWSEYLHRYLVSKVKDSETRLKYYCDLDPETEAYLGMNDKGYQYYAINPYYEQWPQYNDGYDDGGRSSPHTSYVQEQAFAYQITRDTRYARYVYDALVLLGQWEHWGPTHFLNCADATDPTATAFDWAYDGMIEAGLDPFPAGDAIYRNGVYEGYLSIVERRCEHTIPRMSVGWDWLDNWDNWNAVCNSGMTIGCLALMQYDEYTEVIDKQMTKIMPHMCLTGLVEYAPDGSYYESASYWSYGTGNLTQMSAALYSAAGTDYGIFDAWGLDKTWYFAAHSQSSDYQLWNYHDAGTGGSQSTEWFCYAGMKLGDEGLIALREFQSRTKVGYTVWDAIWYRPDLEGLEEVPLPLSYFAEGMDGWMGRSSWDRGAIYACIIGGDNDVAHGDLDSGSFIYFNHGYQYVCDIGCDNYNTYSFFGTSGPRWCHYKEGAEGQNSIIMTSHQDDSAMMYGMNAWTGWGEMYKVGETGYGAYALIDNQNCYNKGRTDDSYITYARRGLLFTNNRRTVVVQDEMSFKGLETVVWIAHKYKSYSYRMSDDGRQLWYTVLNSMGEELTVRLSIVSKNTSFKFEIIDTYEFLLDATYRPGESLALGGTQDEHDRSAFERAIIRCENQLMVNLAVCIEEVENNKDDSPVFYEWEDMNKWNPVAPDTPDVDPEEEEQPEVDPEEESRMIPQMSHILTYGTEFNTYYSSGEVFGAKFGKAYAALVAIYRATQAFKPSGYNGQIKDRYNDYLGWKNDYDTTRDSINASEAQVVAYSEFMMGLA